GRYGLVHRRSAPLWSGSPVAGRPGQSGGPRHVCGQSPGPPAAREVTAGGTGEVRRIEPARPAAVPDGSPAVRVDCGPGRLDRTPEREPAGEIGALMPLPSAAARSRAGSRRAPG